MTKERAFDLEDRLIAFAVRVIRVAESLVGWQEGQPRRRTGQQ